MDGNPLAGEADAGHFNFERINELGQDALRLGNGKAAGGKRRARNRVAPHERQFFVQFDAVVLQNPLDRLAFARVDVAEDH